MLRILLKNCNLPTLISIRDDLIRELSASMTPIQDLPEDAMRKRGELIVLKELIEEQIEWRKPRFKGGAALHHKPEITTVLTVDDLPRHTNTLTEDARTYFDRIGAFSGCQQHSTPNVEEIPKGIEVKVKMLNKLLLVPRTVRETQGFINAVLEHAAYLIRQARRLPLLNNEELASQVADSQHMFVIREIPK
jgi:hypothetical protein